MPEQPRLDLEKTYAAILSAARRHKFISYGDIAAANDIRWSKAQRLIPNHLGHLVIIAHERGWPMPSALVVNKENLETGTFESTGLDGFIAAARDVGITVDDPEAFVRDQQQKVFAWAATAPAELGVADEASAPGGTGPRFVEYFSPVLNALRELGGEASPHAVFNWVKEHVEVSPDELSGVNKGGQSKFENKVAWARFYLAKAGLIDGSKRGVWVLTPEGRETNLDHDAAMAIYKDVQVRSKTVEDEEEPAPDAIPSKELFDDPDRQFWFVGAVWDEGDQLERFIEDGIWQNGYDEKFSEHVKRMRPGDRIAIKASFVRKNNLPFDNRGKSVSCMRIKAVGTITENRGDGKTVRVDWERLEPTRDWFFYTYRITVVEADPNDDLARRLILFTFAGAQQDYEFWTNDVPYFARKYGAVAKTTSTDDLLEMEDEETEEEASVPSYTVDNIIEDGCFLPRATLEEALQRTLSKKNLILQGPPGTGKTWLAKKLAYTLLGSKDKKVTRGRLRVVQFHPSLSYEDFVRGYRPASDGGLELVDGIFLESVQAAAAEPDRPFVLIIEEINRGNPAQIFGEMLTLLEDTKRTLEDAIELAYRREEGERVHIPKNLYVIGTMNIADRSLALVDLALRRRFAFITLEPQFNGAWRNWCTQRCDLDDDVVDMIEERLIALNREIEEDRSLGGQYRIGHSYVTPVEGSAEMDGRQWFMEVSQTEIIPLLEEYWFDAPEKVQAARENLLLGL